MGNPHAKPGSQNARCSQQRQPLTAACSTADRTQCMVDGHVLQRASKVAASLAELQSFHPHPARQRPAAATDLLSG